MGLLIGERGMAPCAFWALTLPEIKAVLGLRTPVATRRDVLEQLMGDFPDGR